MENINIKQELEKIKEDTYNFNQEKKKELLDRLKSKLNGFEIRAEYDREILESHREREWFEDCLKYNNSKIKELREAIEGIEVDLMF